MIVYVSPTDHSIHGDHPGAHPHLHHAPTPGVIPPPKTKWIWKVFWIMLIITLVELFIGFQAEAWSISKTFLKFFFIALTLLKAYYIVYFFMHLKDENKPLRYTILIPYILFIVYLVYICLTEGIYSKVYRMQMDKVDPVSVHGPAEHGDSAPKDEGRGAGSGGH